MKRFTYYINQQPAFSFVPQEIDCIPRMLLVSHFNLYPHTAQIRCYEPNTGIYRDLGTVWDVIKCLMQYKLKGAPSNDA